MKIVISSNFFWHLLFVYSRTHWVWSRFGKFRPKMFDLSSLNLTEWTSTLAKLQLRHFSFHFWLPLIFGSETFSFQRCLEIFRQCSALDQSLSGCLSPRRGLGMWTKRNSDENSTDEREKLRILVLFIEKSFCGETLTNSREIIQLAKEHTRL